MPAEHRRLLGAFESEVDIALNPQGHGAGDAFGLGEISPGFFEKRGGSGKIVHAPFSSMNGERW